MNENYDAMTKRHELELQEMQTNCSHEETEWMPYMWAPGHYGNDVEVCKNCGVITSEKVTINNGNWPPKK